MRISDWSSDVCSSDLEDQRKVLRDAFLDRSLLHAEADIRQPELSGIGKCRILRDQIDPRRIDRLAGDGERVGQEIGRALGRERVCQDGETEVVGGTLKENQQLIMLVVQMTVVYHCRDSLVLCLL